MEDALECDMQNGIAMWADAITKEMKNVQVAFSPIKDGTQPPNGYQFVQCHIIFDIKVEDFSNKASTVPGGHMTDVPAMVTMLVLCEGKHCVLH